MQRGGLAVYHSRRNARNLFLVAVSADRQRTTTVFVFVLYAGSFELPRHTRYHTSRPSSGHYLLAIGRHHCFFTQIGQFAYIVFVTVDPSHRSSCVSEPGRIPVIH